MKFGIKKLALFSLAVLLLASAASTISPHTATAVTAGDWKAGRIIDDSIFTNGGDMSVSDIQAFLDSKNPTCDSTGQKSVGYYYNAASGQPKFSWFSGGTWVTTTRAVFAQRYSSYYQTNISNMPFTCLKNYYEVPKTAPGPSLPASNAFGAPIPAGAISAAQMIYNASTKYSINPKVLLVKLHTESAGPLTTDDWPFQNQYLYAMGAHCPDSGPGGSANCDSNYAGFSIQMDEAAALLRWYLNSMTQSWWQYKKPYQTNSILWNVEPSGCGAGNVYIESKATAALYTYTPYQPNQAALNNMYGTGDGCSAYGNRNFWRVYSDWFGSTQIPSYAAEFVDQSPYLWLKNNGERSTVKYRFRNIGTAAWYDEISAWDANKKPVRLGTDNPLNRSSVFADNWKLGPSRAADTFAVVYEADGTTLAANQHIVQPGQIASFVFSMKVPVGMSSGYSIESFKPIVEGWGAMWTSAAYYTGVTIESSAYQYAFKGQSPYPTMQQGSSSPVWFQYQNNGNVAWYDSASASLSGQLPVRLGTDNPLNRSSVFADNWKLGPSRAADTFAVVYEADGTTLAANQHIVQPGQIARFNFLLRAPPNTQQGIYAEAFRPIVEGWGAMSGPGTWLGISIQQTVYSYLFRGQSDYPSIDRGQYNTAWIKYQNNGNVAWYDEASAWTAGQFPVRLATDGPLNRTSAFNDSWWLGPTRPAHLFAAVYEADGVTLAANQHIVQPGQIAKMSFNLRTPIDKSGGFYPETFRPIVEGRGPMSGVGTWLGVTVP